MRLFSFLFDDDTMDIEGPDIRFGRYSDAIKTNVQYQAWEQSIMAFKKEQYQKSLLSFLDYLHDKQEENVEVKTENDNIYFSIRQGSTLIQGQADETELKATVRIATAPDFSIKLLRELLESNYSLQYCRYAMENKELVLYFFSYMADAYPYKLYQGLKELAIKADKLDDLIASEYEEIVLVNESLQIPIMPIQKNIKAKFVRNRLQSVLHFYDHNHYLVNHNPGAIAYRLLACCYKLDYLTKPEGFITDSFEKIHQSFFSNSSMDLVVRNKVIYDYLDKLTKKPIAALEREFYRIKSTFSIVQPVDHGKIKKLIASETTNMQWYIDNEMEEMVVAMTEYIAGYALFNYAVPPPIKDLFHLYFMIQEQNYFNELGFKYEFLKAKSFESRAIRKYIKSIKNKHVKLYPNFNPAYNILDYSSNLAFSKSYLDLVYEVDLTTENIPYGFDDTYD